MSQSKLAYEVRDLEGNEQRQRQRQNTSEIKYKPESAQEPEPACRSRSIGRAADRREWREISYDERLLAFYSPCSWDECFPNGNPDASEIETVIGSRHHPTTFHRPRDSDRPRCTDGETATDTDTRAHATSREVHDITELEDGDGIVWQGQSTPLTVVSSTDEPSGTIALRGPKNGEYRVKGRPNQPRAIAIYPGIGVIANARVVPADTRTEEV